MKRILFLFSLILIISFSETTDPSKILIIYFSKTGNTEKFANYITEISNEISAFKIEPATSYPIIIQCNNCSRRTKFKCSTRN